MKKHWHNIKYKNHALRRAKRQELSGLRFKDYQRLRRQGMQGEPRHKAYHSNGYKHHESEYFHLEAPRQLTFIDNPDEVCEFIAQLDRCFQRRMPVYVILKNIEKIDFGAIAVLLSVMIRFKSHSIRFNGNMPDDPIADKKLKESRFFEYLRRNYSDLESYEFGNKSSIYSHAKKRVDPELSERVIASASRTIWEEERRCPGAYKLLIELMHNTNNHASPDTEGEKHWWLSVKHSSENNRVAFSFVDYGVGVFKSLKNKRAGNRFYGAWDELVQRTQYGGNEQIMKLIFEGELHRTVTQNSYRGKGLPRIYREYTNKGFSDFVMITNDVVYDSRKDEYRRLGTPFSGTFVYWALEQHNRNLKNEN